MSLSMLTHVLACPPMQVPAHQTMAAALTAAIALAAAAAAAIALAGEAAALTGRCSRRLTTTPLTPSPLACECKGTDFKPTFAARAFFS